MAEQRRKQTPIAVRATPDPTPQRDAPPSAAAPAQERWRAAALIFCIFVVLGAAPAMLTGDTLGLWHVGGFGSIYPTPTPTATPAPDLALPRQAWIATETQVLPEPGGGAPIALLEPGFPVTLTAHQRHSGAVWSHIQWGGPSAYAGGAGWMPDAALVTYDSGARPLGDLGALSPSLGSAMAGYKSSFAAALYFPNSGQLYRANADQSIVLGDAFRPILLVASFAAAESQHKAAPATSASSLAAQVAAGSPVAAATLYEQLGDAPGVTRFLTSAGVSGIQPVPLVWAAARGTPTALLQFYTLLATGGLLNSADRSAVLTLLAHADAQAASALLGGKSPGAGALVIASNANGSALGASLVASGIVAPSGGPRYVIVAAITNQADQTAAQQVLATFFQRLGAILS